MDFKRYVKRLHKWEKYKTKFNSLFDDFDRVRRHYIGNRLFKKWIYIRANIICVVIYPLLLLMIRIKKLDKQYIPDSKSSKVAVFVCPNDEYRFVLDDIPDLLIEKYKTIKYISGKEYKRMLGDFALDDQGIKICSVISKRFPYALFMNTSIIVHLLRIQRIIRKYNPRAIITTQTDEDFTTSLLTYYCEKHGIEYIGIQHGAYCYDPNLAYFRFSEYYAWDQETIDNLELVNTKLDFARIFECNRFKKQLQKKNNPQFHITYYLAGDENRYELNNIKNTLLKFVKSGYSTNVRNHPRSNNTRLMNKIFVRSGINIEDAKTVTIEDSITNTDYIVATRSTVLLEALTNQLEAVIDDVTYSIEDMRYIRIKHLNQINLLLSQIIMRELGHEK